VFVEINDEEQSDLKNDLNALEGIKKKERIYGINPNYDSQTISFDKKYLYKISQL
jgi:hypothetical protein